MFKSLYYLTFTFTVFLVSCNSQSNPTTNEGAKTEAATEMDEATSKQIIKTDKAPNPVGPYNQAIMAGNTLYLAGQIAIKPESGEMITSSIEEEATQVMNNLKAILNEGGMDMNNVVHTTIYMTDLNDFGKVNEIYGSYFDNMAPSRVTVGVASLPKGAHLEISMIAVE
ncbi:2-iminobutanoate/2-iminopropanoate deaminase [Catalinimonas alkaloidigena]|uniref:RidA family protein n=1 Tax=Catalinimonas alkaloidigena TaxID=1075417 RepID=UPI0030B8CBCC|nr:2-iminobutanoate/2-iminopropanoate deaminase [Catalinimonas alkaloidigena]